MKKNREKLKDINKIFKGTLVFFLILPMLLGVFLFFPERVESSYDSILLETNDGPTYRLKLDGNLVESISSNSVSGTPDSYSSTIIPNDTGQSGVYTGAQETNFTNATDVNGGVTYRKAVSFWTIIDTFGTGTGANARLIWEEGGTTNWWSAYTFNGDSLGISIGESYSDVGNCSVSGLSTGNLYHVVMQWDGLTETMELWLNGVLECSTTTSTGGSLSAHTGDWEIAGASDAPDATNTVIGQRFIGKIADYAYWAEPTRLLTESEIVNIHKNGDNVPPSPVIGDIPFNNKKTGDQTQPYEFTGTDPDGTADLIYQIRVDDDSNFTSPLIDCSSDTVCNTGSGTFLNTITGGDTSPFNENELINFTPTTNLTNNTTYYWQVRVKGDIVSGGAGIYGNWSSVRSLTYISETDSAEWFQTTDAQFNMGTLTTAKTTGSGSVDIGGADNPYIKVKRGLVSFPINVTTVDVSLEEAVVNIDNSFIMMSQTGSGTSGAQNMDQIYSIPSFVDNSTIRFTRNTGSSSADLSWQVIEADNNAPTPAFFVERATTSFGSTETTKNITLSNITDYTKAVVFVYGTVSTDKSSAVQYTTKLNSNTSLDITRQATGATSDVSVFVVQFSSDFNVYKGETIMSGTSLSTNIGGTIDRNRSALFMSYNSNTEGLAQTAVRGYLNSNNTQVTFTKATSTGANTIDWSIVEFPVEVVVQSDNGLGSPSTKNNSVTVSPVIELDDSGTLVWSTNMTTGTGTAFPRTLIKTSLFDNSTIRFDVSYNGQTNTMTYYAVDFSGWTYTISTTSGTIKSKEVKFSSLPGSSSWDSASFSTDETNGDIKLQIYHTTSQACDTIIPDGDLAGNSTGFDVSETPIDLSSLNITTYDRICLKAILTDINGTPYLNDWGLKWGSSVSLPTLNTQNASSITQTSATANGNIIDTGGENNIKRGFVYSVSSQVLPGNVTPTSSGYTSYVEDTGSYSSGVFTKELTGLASGITYYVRAYSYNSGGYSYGGEVNFTTLALPIIINPTVASITRTTATLGAEVSWLGEPSLISARGIVYGTSPYPTANVTVATGTTTGVYVVDISSLTCGTLYYYRGYATNTTGTAYSLDDSFTTESCFNLPNLTTETVTALETTSATLNGTITNTGGEGATVRGFEYGETASYGNTTIENGTFETGAYTADITSLTCGTTYHYRSYATNSAGTGYGNDQTFTPGSLGSCFPVFTQSDYRFFSNSNEADVGYPLESKNTPAILERSGDKFRLRILIGVENNPLTISGEDFKLQYSEKVGTCDTSFNEENYLDITRDTKIAYYDNFYPENNINLISNTEDPTPDMENVLNQSYVESNNFTNSFSSIEDDQYGMWDFSLYDKNTDSNISYCLRVVKEDDSLLDSYAFIPEITTPIYRSRGGGSIAKSVTPSKCSDGIDNDEDSYIDENDFDCHLDGILENEYISSWNSETTPPVSVDGGDQSGTASGGEILSTTNSPGSASDVTTVGTLTWSNPTNILSSDDSYATVSKSNNLATSHYLLANNFGFNIPIEATIDGILVEIERKPLYEGGGSSAAIDSSVLIVKADGSYGLTDKASSIDWVSTEDYYSYGGDSDLWNESWTPSDINDSDFGVALSAIAGVAMETQILYVDNIKITVYYITPGEIDEIDLMACNDSLDNDTDTLTDEDDPQCHMDGLLDNEYIFDWNSEIVAPVSETGGSAGAPGGDLGIISGLKNFAFNFYNFKEGIWGDIFNIYT